MKKITLLSCLILTSSTLYAIPIVQGNLSSNAQNNVQNQGRNTSVPPSTGQAVASTQSWELYQQIQQLQNQIRELRGQIEEQNNQIEQLNNEMKNRYTDLDQRLELLQQGSSDDLTDESSDNTTATQSIETDNTHNNTQLDQAAYNIAYDAYKQGGAAKAIAPMENFIKNHPNSPYVSHAYYWLGEFNLSLTPANFNEAKENFIIVAGNYPKSTKAPTALYRLSEIAKNIDKDIPKAREYYLRLIQNYANSEDAKKARTEINL